MFGINKNIEQLKKVSKYDIEYLDIQFRLLRDNHYALRARYNALLKHLGLEEVEEPAQTVFRKKEN